MTQDDDPLDLIARGITSDDISLIQINARLEARIVVYKWITAIQGAVITSLVLHWLF